MTAALTASKKKGNRSPELIIIRPTRGLGALNLKDLWVYRELIYFMTWRDIKVRYKQTLLGAGWAILQPFLRMVVFSLLFGGIAKLEYGLPYPLFNFAALLPWGLFEKAMNDAGRSLVANRNMITKVYFPRMIIPLASVISGLVDFAIAMLVLVGIIVFYHLRPESNFDFQFTPALAFLPLLILLALVTALGVSLWLSAMNVIYRDVGYVLPFLTQLWFFVTPVVYSSTDVPEKLRLIYALNPMTGVVEGFRWALLGSQAPGSMIWMSAVIAVCVLISGMFYFRQMERRFADEI